MNAKIQKEFKLIIGTNDSKATLEDLDKTAFDFETKANAGGDGFRYHLLEVK